MDIISLNAIQKLKKDLKSTYTNTSSPLLDLPLQNGLVMEKGTGVVYFSRSTTGTYIDRYGVLKTAGVDEPREEKEGLLIEGSSTNLTLNSNTFGVANYPKSGTRASVKSSSELFIDDINTMGRFTEDSSTNVGHYVNPFTSISYEANTPYTISFYAKEDPTSDKRYCYLVAHYINDSGDTHYITIGYDLATGTEVYTNENDASGYFINKNITYIGDGVYRISTTFKYGTASTNASSQIRFDKSPNRITNYDGDGSSGGFIFGAQVEKLPFASSYIHTTDSAVTRGADVLKIDFQGNHPSLKAGNPFSIYVKYDTHEVPTFERVILHANSNAYLDYHNLLRINRDSSSLLYYRDPAGIGKQNSYKGSACITVDDYELTKLYFNGVLSAKRVQHLTNIAGTNSSIYIGSNSNGTNQIFGHISHYKVYDKALTATEVALLG